MPNYKYKCRECENYFSIKASMQKKEAGLDPVCPECESDDVFQVLDSIGVLGSSSNNGQSCSTCPPGANCCG